MAVTSPAGVTSKARLSTATPAGTTRAPATVAISSAGRRSRGMAVPLGKVPSIEDVGAAT
jgi:hypothetical protein